MSMTARFPRINLWRLLRGAGIAALVLYVVFLLLVIALRYVVVPQIERYKPELEQRISQALKLQVSIGNLTAGFHGIWPEMTLTDVLLRDASGREALRLPKVDAAVSWRSIPSGTMVFHRLHVDQPDLQVRRFADGKFSVAGIIIDPQDKTQGGGLKWFLEQGEVSIAGGKLTWMDERAADGQPLQLNDVRFLYQRLGLMHRMAMRATPPEAFGSPLDVRLNFLHGLFEREDLVENWDGELYANLARADLAQWTRYFELPLQIRQGQGGMRFWLDFDDLTVQKITTDLRMTDLRAKLGKDLPELEFAAVDGRIEGRQIARGTASHDLTVSNLRVTTRDGASIGPLTLSESYRVATADKGASGTFAADALDLGLFAQWSERMPLTPTVREALTKFNPRGQLQQVKLEWQAPNGAEGSTRFAAKGAFTGLSVAAQADRATLQRLLAPQLAAKPATAPAGSPDLPKPGVPGFTNLTGKFDVSEKGGSLVLDSKDARLDFPGVFAESALPMDKLALTSTWRVVPAGVEVKINDLQFANADMQGNARADYKTGGKGPGILDLEGTLTRASASAVHAYLPLRVPELTRDWLKKALKGGAVNSATFKVRGDLYEFPYHAVNGAKPTGDFLINARVSGVEFDFAPNPLESGARWLPLEDVSGTFFIERTKLGIKDAQARMMGTRLSRVNAEIADTVAHAPLIITGETSGPAQDLLTYVNTSPIALWINKFTQESKISGNTRMNLKLTLPLSDMRSSQVAGSVQFAGNDIALAPDLPAFAATTATLEFSEKGIQVPSARATVYGGPATFSGGTQPDGSLKFSGQGNAEIKQAKNVVGDPMLATLIGTATGALQYTLNLGVRGGVTELKLASDLNGVAFDFPGLLAKAANQTMPLGVSVTPKPRATADAALTDELAITLGTALNARFERVKHAAGGMRIVRGGVGINNEAVVPDSGTIAIVNLKRLDADLWLRKLDELQLSMPQQTGGTPVAGADEVSLVPKMVAVRADELIVGGKKWDSVVAGASREGDVWQINMDATQLSGYATWRQARPGQREAMGRLTARLAKLTIPQAQRDEVAKMLDTPTASDLPGIDLVVEDFELGGKKLGRLEVQASNAQAWQLEKLLVENADAKLTGTGVWQRASGNAARLMELEFALDIGNAGNLLTRLGFANTVRNGAGKFTGKINWRGIPLTLDFPSMAGDVQLSLDKGGQFLKTDPGVGRLLGVLSLQSLPRRLSLDFRDVFSEGFVFDNINATATIKGGLLNTENFKMKGPQATVLLAGNADLVREQQNLRIVVLPDINFGAVSFAYLFINPAIGLTSFLAQLVAREPLAKGLAQEFDIAGTWAEPKITKRERAPVNNGNGIEPGE
ncbi:MAG: YhdP family protein [Burkholderiaceae bacterium]